MVYQGRIDRGYRTTDPLSGIGIQELFRNFCQTKTQQ